MAGHLSQPTISQGFRAYMGFLARSGLPAVAATCKEYLELGNRNARFQRYVEEFGDNWPRQDSSLSDRQAIAEALLDGIEDEPAPKANKGRKPRSNSNGRLAKGDTFTYAGKRRKSTWTIIKIGHKWATKSGDERTGYLARSSEGRESGWSYTSVERMLKSGKISI